MAESKRRKASQNSTNSQRSGKRASRSARRRPKRLEPFTVEHFRRYAQLLVYDDEEQRDPEDWQLAIAEDIFAGYREVWSITPEGNGKSTFIAMLALYGADYSRDPWIPVGAAAVQQARIVYQQAEGFINRTEGMSERFKAFGGYKLIRSLRNDGVGIQVYAHDPKTGDGVIPYPFAILDELHRHPDLRLYSLWKGKLRKRGAQVLATSTAGEPNSPFENQREEIRNKATERHRDGAYLRAEGGGLALHEYMVQSDEDCSDMEAVKAANPLKAITVESLRDEYESPTKDEGDWKRLKCNRPARSTHAAISDKEWDEAYFAGEIPEGEDVTVGIDVAWKIDTTAIVPLWAGPKFRLLGDPHILTPPRDGTSLHPDEIKSAIFDLTERYRVTGIAMDTSKAEDIAAWLEDELDLTAAEWGTSNKFAVEDYNSVMDGLRNGTLKHTGSPGLRTHAMNAIARRLPGGDHRFDRPVQSRRNLLEQDRRVIDALTAAGMAVSYSLRQKPPKRSVYDERRLLVVG